MKTISNRLLGQYLAGALEPPERRRVERALAERPEARSRLDALRALEHDEPRHPWIVPPPSLPSALQATSAPAAVMEAGSGAWLVVRLAVADDQQDHVVVVLERTGEAWEVVFPATAEERTTVGMLPREGEQARLDLAEIPPRRIAVALVPPDVAIRFESGADERWSAVRAGLASGTIPVVSFDTP